jgi:hypothetical protein
MQTLHINIADLKHYNRSLITKWLSIHNADNYIIEIPWENYHLDDKVLEVIFNYQSAAYAGDLLALCSNTFKYNTPLPNEETFKFTITPICKKRLAQKLSLIVDGYFSNDEKMTNYTIRSNKHFLKVVNGKLLTAVPGLIALADDYLTQF